VVGHNHRKRAPATGGAIVDFGAFEHVLRAWIDRYLDHGTMLGPADPLLPLLHAERCKVYELEGWPTVENVAALLAEVGDGFLNELARAPGAYVASVHLAESHSNAFTWMSPIVQGGAHA